MQVLKNDIALRDEKKAGTLLATANFQRVQAVCEDARNHRKMVALVGEPGYGKTSALKYFARTQKNVFYMAVKPSMTPKFFWESLFETVSDEERRWLGMNTRPRALYFIMQAAAELLNSYQNALLVIDEAGKFTSKMFEYLHELRDSTQGNAGIVLAGPAYWKRNLYRWVKSERVGMPEVWRRINYWEELLPPERSEVKAFCEYHQVTDAAVVRRLAIECRNFGTLANSINEYLAGNMKL